MVKVRHWMAAACMGAALCAQAGAIYAWKDAQGVVHMGDVVPRQYAHTAKKLDVKVVNQGFSLPKAPAASSPQTDAASNAKPAAPEAPQTASSAPATVATGSDSCARQKQAYEESVACFARYRQGRRLVGDYAKCPVVEKPNC